VEEKPPQQKPKDTARLIDAQQDAKANWVLAGDELTAESLRNTNRRLKRVHVRVATLKKRFGVF
jgi:hypothetical protein